VVTIRDIAKATGFSIATVSLTLNKAGRRIPASTQEQITRAARRLGYFPNLQARSLRSKRTHSVGVLVFDITDPYCTLILRGIENSLYKSGYMPILSDLQNNPKRLRQCTQMLMERRVEGLIAIANPVHLGTDISSLVQQFNIPTVVIGSRSKDDSYGSVVVDNQLGTRLLMEHLIALGHRDFAIIKGPKAMIDSAPRWEGIQCCVRAHGLHIDPELIAEIRGRNSSYEEAYQLTQRLISRKKPFTALVAFDDLTAFAAIGALSHAGKRVPEDCSVGGFDDIPGAAFYNPPLTTVHQKLEQQGSHAAEIVEAMVSDKSRALTPAHETVTPTLVVRKSTARPLTVSGVSHASFESS
jgi:LacI family transcriptional regulator